MKKLCLIALLTVSVVVGGCAAQKTAPNPTDKDAMHTKTQNQGQPPKEVAVKYQNEPVVLAKLETPLKGMIQIKSFPIDGYGRKITLELWASSDVQNTGGALQGYLKDGGQTYYIGSLGPYITTNKYKVETLDINADGSKELLVSIDAGGSAVESNVITFDKSNVNWIKVLTAPVLVFRDLDGDGKDEVVGITRDVNPEKLWLYKIDKGSWSKADILTLSKQYYAKLAEAEGKTTLQLGQDPKKPHTYTLKGDKLVLAK